AAGSNRFRTVAEHLAAFQQTSDERMRLTPLKLRIAIEQRILVVETSYVANIQNAVLHAINPASPIRVHVWGIAQRVCDATCWIAIVGQFPQLFNADTVDLRLAPLVGV